MSELQIREGRYLTKQVAREMFDYDAETGNLVWIKTIGTRSSHHLGRIAGGNSRSSPDPRFKSYWVIRFNGRKIPAHHIVWAWHNDGDCPSEIDHINGDSLDNRIENLRSVDRSQNCMNRRNRKDNLVGLKGARVRRRASGEMVYYSSIFIGGKDVHLGVFRTAEEAHEAYIIAAKINFGEYARGE